MFASCSENQTKKQKLSIQQPKGEVDMNLIKTDTIFGANLGLSNVAVKSF